MNEPVLSEFREAAQDSRQVDRRGYIHIPDAVKESAQLHLNPMEPRLIEPLPFFRNIEVLDTANRVQEWIPAVWWFWPLGESAARGPFRWDQMLGWNLQDLLPPDLQIQP